MCKRRRRCSGGHIIDACGARALAFTRRQFAQSRIQILLCIAHVWIERERCAQLNHCLLQSALQYVRRAARHIRVRESRFDVQRVLVALERVRVFAALRQRYTLRHTFG